MSAFSPEWLALREGADARARDATLAAALRALRLPGRALRCVDLGSGSGANLRYMAPLLGYGQHWLLIDNDARLLAHARRAMLAWSRAHGYAVTPTADGLRIEAHKFSATLHWQLRDLAAQIESLTLDAVDLVTASALLDLVSREWIEKLVRKCEAQRCAALFALSYAGQIAWRPSFAADSEVNVLFNRHQGRDKGFGPAAGPQAAAYMRHCLQMAKFRVREVRSDWRLAGADAQLQAALARGWAQAALEFDPARRPQIDAWLELRLGHIARQDSSLTLSHIDLLGLPPSI